MEAMSRSPMYRARRALNLSVQKYAAIMRVSIANNLAYVMEVFFRALLLVVLVFVLGQLWTTTYTNAWNNHTGRIQYKRYGVVPGDCGNNSNVIATTHAAY